MSATDNGKPSGRVQVNVSLPENMARSLKAVAAACGYGSGGHAELIRIAVGAWLAELDIPTSVPCEICRQDGIALPATRRVICEGPDGVLLRQLDLCTSCFEVRKTQ